LPRHTPPHTIRHTTRDKRDTNRSNGVR
jgi:hypothetical protein